MKQEFYSNGKLLLTGEYIVLDGATALAFPTKFGQSMKVSEIEESKIIWNSYNSNGKLWLQYDFNLKDLEVPLNNVDDEKKRLLSILKEAKILNPNFLNNTTGYQITTKLDFPRNWGLGSSSTLINNISQWAKVDPYNLLKATFGGSGYDIAAAQNNSPILYSQSLNKTQVVKQNVDWDFTDQLFFVHLNKKQNSRDGIANYQKSKENNLIPTKEINELTSKFCHCKSISEFELLINEHEQVISNIIEQKPIKERLFNDYTGSIKSLGAWGGDFILATGSQKNWNYFKDKGYHTILSFKEMIL